MAKQVIQTMSKKRLAEAFLRVRPMTVKDLAAQMGMAQNVMAGIVSTLHTEGRVHKVNNRVPGIYCAKRSYNGTAMGFQKVDQLSANEMDYGAKSHSYTWGMVAYEAELIQYEPNTEINKLPYAFIQ